jgi:DNA-binding transcriptional LysR family regulator
MPLAPAPPPHSLDPDLLRAFVFIAEDGSFSRAAERVGRTQSAVSMQVQRLEAALGKRLFQRARGGHVALTAHGAQLLDRARELLRLNDAIWTSFHTPQVQGRVRLGTPDDYALRYLPPVLKSFADTHPAIEVEVDCLPSVDLIPKLRDGELDLTLLSEGEETAGLPCVQLWRGPLRWITSDRYAPHRLDPLPLALSRTSCSWGRAAVQALEEAGRPYRVAYTAASQIGSHAPVMAGLAVTVSTISWVPDGLRVVRRDEGLPDLPDFSILLAKGRDANQPVTDVLASHIMDTFRAEMRRMDRAA